MPENAAPEALILAAGRGSRLKHHTRDLPKPLVEVDGETLLGRQLRLFGGFGVRRSVVVTGYRSRQIREYLGAHHPEAEAVQNPRFADPGSARSLLAGAEVLTGSGPVLLAHGDLFYAAEMLDELFLAGPSATLADADWRAETGDEVVIGSVGGLACGLGRGSVPGAEATGEFVGLSLLDRDLWNQYVDFARAHPELDYEIPLLGRFCEERRGALRVRSVRGVFWRNVNHPEDLAAARERCGQ